MEWTDSETRHHLMQAFFMESQAHSRYAFAALQAEQGGLEVVRRSFAAAAAQEEVHARAFYRLLAPCAGQILPLEGCCAVSGGGGISAMLREAGQSEREGRGGPEGGLSGGGGPLCRRGGGGGPPRGDL